MSQMRKLLQSKSKINIILFVVLFLFSITIYYNDLQDTSEASVILWDCVFSGKLLQFFAASGRAYPITLYAIFAIFNLPFYILKVFGINLVSSFLWVFYEKAILFGFLYWACQLIRKLCKDCSLSDKSTNTAIFFFLSSSFLGYGTSLIGQCEIITVCFIMLGLEGYIKNKHKSFIGWFSLAITCKMFALVAFIPLLLAKHKKLSKVFTSFCIALIPLLLTHKNGIVFGWFPYIGSSPAALEQILLKGWLSTGVFSIGNYSISIFIIIYIVYCVYLYNRKENKNPLETINICCISFVSFLFLFGAYPYWYVLFTPFFSILAANSRYRNFLVLSDGICGMMAVLLFQAVNFPWTTGLPYFKNTLVDYLFSIDYSLDPYNASLLQTLSSGETLNNLIGGVRIIGGSIVLALILSSLYYCQPKFSITNNSETIDVDLPKSYIVWRILFLLVILIHPLAVLLTNI